MLQAQTTLQFLLSPDEVAEYSETVELVQADDTEYVDGYGHASVAVRAAPFKTCVSGFAMGLSVHGLTRIGHFVEMGCPHSVTYRVNFELPNGDLLCEKVWEKAHG